MTQKILAAHAGLESVEAGQLIEADLDLVLGNDITSPVAIKEMEKTIDNFTNHFTELNGVFACNCILRKLQFQQERLFGQMNERLKQLPNLCGFSSYGEQLNKSQLNQTMVLIGFGKLRAE